MISKIPLYRSLLVIIGSFLGAGVCIHFFRKYKINYIYIFEIVPSNKLNQYQMIKIFLYLLFLWVMAAIIEVIRIKQYVLWHIGIEEMNSEPALFLVSIIIFLLVNPLET